MAIIYSYPTVEPKLIDKILITQSYNADDEEPIEGNPTKSIKISSIGQLLGTTGTANTIPMFSSTGLVDSQLTQIRRANGLYQMKLSNTDRFIIDKTSSVTSGDPEYLITQDGTYKVSMGWDDDGAGFGFLYNWSGNGWRFGAAGNNPELTIVTTAGSEGVVVENKLTVPKINFGYNAYYGRDMFISGIGDGTFDGVQVTNEFVIGKEADTTGDIAMYFKYGDERVGGIFLDDDASQQGLVFYVRESATNADIVKKISLKEGTTIGSALTSTLPPANGLAVQGDLVSGGGVRMADVTDVASSANAGMLKYRISGNNSYVDMCMQTGAATYAWINIKQNNW